jgi:excisionase family DNA binding protein
MPKIHTPAAGSASGPSTSYSTQEAATLLGTSVQTVQRWMDLGHLGGWRTPGGHRRIDPAGVERLLRMAASQAATAPTETSGPGAGLRVLLVDDSADDLEFLDAVTRAVIPGAVIVKATSGFSALILIGRDKPDLLITDIAMDGFDGIEMIRSLRDDVSTVRLPVIAVSGHKAEEIEHRFGALPDAVAILKKPVSPKMLRDTLQQIAPGLMTLSAA